MPRFVVLEHTRDDGRHFDLMLEGGEVLLTFSFAALPAAGAVCERLFDHPVRFLDYEGELTGGQGTVTRVESGTFDLLAETPEGMHVHLRGTRLQGVFRLSSGEGTCWTFAAE